MQEDFVLPVNFNGSELLLPSTFIQFGYSYKIDVDVNGIILSFEKDDEGSWRAIMDASLVNSTTISKGLLSAIVQSLDTISQ
jgi:hypothetical protein